MKQILIFLAILFLGFAVGRVGHILGGQLKSPHHWIYGLILIIVGIIFRKNTWGIWALSFGIGLFISDLKDFMTLKFYGVDDVKIKKFWEID
ncbi:MAG: hypothetical protein US94_C0037G0009 [Berkelbacteria bacterium GW2011_GWB1_38_5]|uniref:Uncharacterized protein n=1 Tax=Berkelbacteria bacterium GW2011_GWB1_38_5 TaxID=1618336 RepID=A0A0G0KCG1_9BACT|nr:MAG: hypothetical protein US94_C0037G0009 [Berkelbacteria bacterium GW2011_GWB1_38_5]